MQLKKKKSVRSALALATSSMLAASMQPASAVESDSSWEVDSAVLFYSEKDRVSVIEPVVRARKEIGEDEFLNLRLVLDSLTGSSANGAIPTSSPQTFTSPSGDSTYTTPANETPLDPTFHDTRVAFSVDWEKPINKTLRAIYSANLSKEFDYTSLGLSAQYAWDFNQRNTTFTAGVSYNLDTVNPVGDIPVGLTSMPTTTAVSKASSDSEDTKNVAELLLGITQVIDRNTLMQFNYTYGNDSGYLTDPYKILSVVDGTGNLRAVDPYLYENRPDSRTRHALFWKTVHQFTEDVIDFSYRYYWDDWGINSHTFDVKYRYQLNDGDYLQPHFRYYSQGEADFYNYKLADGSIPEYASADYRLGKLTGTTYGIKYGIALDKQSEFSVRAELMKQSVDAEGPVPDLDAVILQLNYSFRF